VPRKKFEQSCSLLTAHWRLIRQGRLLPRREVRDAWAAHEAHDLYPTMSDVHALCDEILPGAKIQKHLLWRYSNRVAQIHLMLEARVAFQNKAF
jgi:hypothetical protein